MSAMTNEIDEQELQTIRGSNKGFLYQHIPFFPEKLKSELDNKLFQADIHLEVHLKKLEVQLSNPAIITKSVPLALFG